MPQRGRPFSASRPLHQQQLLHKKEAEWNAQLNLVEASPFTAAEGPPQFVPRRPPSGRKRVANASAADAVRPPPYRYHAPIPRPHSSSPRRPQVATSTAPVYSGAATARGPIPNPPPPKKKPQAESETSSTDGVRKQQRVQIAEPRSADRLDAATESAAVPVITASALKGFALRPTSALPVQLPSRSPPRPYAETPQLVIPIDPIGGTILSVPPTKLRRVRQELKLEGHWANEAKNASLAFIRDAEAEKLERRRKRKELQDLQRADYEAKKAARAQAVELQKQEEKKLNEAAAKEVKALVEEKVAKKQHMVTTQQAVILEQYRLLEEKKLQDTKAREQAKKELDKCVEADELELRKAAAEHRKKRVAQRTDEEKTHLESIQWKENQRKAEAEEDQLQAKAYHDYMAKQHETHMAALDLHRQKVLRNAARATLQVRTADAPHQTTATTTTPRPTTENIGSSRSASAVVVPSLAADTQRRDPKRIPVGASFAETQKWQEERSAQERAKLDAQQEVELARRAELRQTLKAQRKAELEQQLQEQREAKLRRRAQELQDQNALIDADVREAETYYAHQRAEAQRKRDNTSAMLTQQLVESMRCKLRDEYLEA